MIVVPILSVGMALCVVYASNLVVNDMLTHVATQRYSRNDTSNVIE